MNAPAGFWRRYVAYSVDALILSLITLPLLWSSLRVGLASAEVAFGQWQQRLLALMAEPFDIAANPLSLALAWAADPALEVATQRLADVLAGLFVRVAAILFIAAAIYFIASESSRWQASPGKRLLGLRVTDLAGHRPERFRIVLRFLSGILSWLLLNLGHALVAWTPDKRALHDYLAGTRVERLADAPATMPAWARAWLWLQAVIFAGLLALMLRSYLQLLSGIAGAGPP